MNFFVQLLVLQIWKYTFLNHLDIHFCDIINKNVISDVLTSYFISVKYFFFENMFWYAASKISIFVNL